MATTGGTLLFATVSLVHPYQDLCEIAMLLKYIQLTLFSLHAAPSTGARLGDL